MADMRSGVGLDAHRSKLVDGEHDGILEPGPTKSFKGTSVADCSTSQNLEGHGCDEMQSDLAGNQGVDGATSTESNKCFPWLLCRLEHRVIVAVLVGAAVLLALGPFSCISGIGRADVADSYRAHAHGPENGEQCYSCRADSGHKFMALNIDRTYANEVVFGGLNGLLLMVTTVLGGIGADLPGHGIMAVGAANLVAYGSSLGFGTYVVQLAKDEFSTSQLMEEHEEVQTMPEQEINEMVCHYKSRGLSEEDARTVASVLSKYEDYWVEHMMNEELGVDLPRGNTAAAASGVATTLSFVGFGAVPLLGMIVSLALRLFKGPQWYRPQFATMIALALSASALALLGVFLSRVVGSRAPLWNGVTLLALGCCASVLSLLVGEACKALYRQSTVGPHPVSNDRNQSAIGATAGASQSQVDGAGGLTRSLSHSKSSEWTPYASTSAWPSFRRQFMFGICFLWVVVATLLAVPQILERAGYQSLRVFGYGMVTCVTTGLGALPFKMVRPEDISEKAMAVANAAAGGMMLAASAGMLLEAHEHCGTGDWQMFAGLLAGAVFIKFSEWLHGDEDGEQADVEVLHAALVERHHFRKALLIFTVMFFHSAAEGIAVGVAFSKQLPPQFGLYVSLLLAIHNIPEGLTVALVLVPRGVSTALAAGIATLTSVPQPLLAVVAYLFVDSFAWLLPLGLAFAAGAMVYVCLHELLTEAVEQMGWASAVSATSASFVTMSIVQYTLHSLSGL